jgi:hypothetical protein
MARLDDVLHLGQVIGNVAQERVPKQALPLHFRSEMSLPSVPDRTFETTPSGSTGRSFLATTGRSFLASLCVRICAEAVTEAEEAKTDGVFCK